MTDLIKPGAPPPESNGLPPEDPCSITYSMYRSATDYTLFVTFRIPETVTMMLSKDQVIQRMHEQLLRIFAERK